ncbi:dTDP-4-dehydrorhamnose 3,5-epimerase [Longispora fulva]|uniref:dTDP-4-dehydrorhamnose 3,5-epimerase n=1 Tax=Longispora fulva TaxID=619741 RepID=A0A8J7KKZ4_9ACTN|nr:dTDP-4-dehydrorhamnose 3,5-epimerase family protein [Longispora fulva]MBG6137346.1 dTDP-4-dehydrorhamnose 3,5-epimerase [Longispora fulva]GIG61300.1 dTDP-4-dehydrorhamnose 3,5-epimerase [Longispora fulva]
MRIEPLGIDGAYTITPVQHPDSRGAFLEWYRDDLFTRVAGHPVRLRQANTSVSARGTVRGVHFADTPPGQAKYVTCQRGAVLDFVIDVRVGSPTFGQHRIVRLDDVDRRGVYLAEGLGHAICALEDHTTLLYLVSERYDPAAERVLSPLDPDLQLDLPFGRGELILSDKDAAAPTLAELAAAGALPDYASCVRWYSELKTEGV